MRNLNEMNRHRVKSGFGWNGDHSCGAFAFDYRGAFIRVIASSGEGWDHVSVSLETRCPTWDEMEFVKRKFFNDDETAMQLHVPPSDHINHHPHCLHLWRPHGEKIPRPPNFLVGAPA